jgi:FlaA1/EpsC-like NDP-sugar epimerase
VGGRRFDNSICANCELRICEGLVDKMIAVVTGGTGAIGRELVGDLLRSDAWSKVVVVSRTALPPSTAP